MEKPAWHQRLKLDTSFPFRLWESSLSGFTTHWHELLEIAYVREGSYVMVVEGRSYELSRGDIVIVNSGATHGFSDAGPDSHLVLTQFGLELFDQSLIDLRDRVFQQLVFGRKPRVTKGEDGDIHGRLERLILDLREEYLKKPEGYRLAIRARLYELALLLVREVPARQVLPEEIERRRARNATLERALILINDRYAESLSLDDAAEAAHLSRFYFSRFFREQTGQTFHTYLSRVRVSRAEELLCSTDDNVTDIAYLCGFASLKTFNRVFRHYSGTSPSRYRLGGCAAVAATT